jgi:hypothetical protein
MRYHRSLHSRAGNQGRAHLQFSAVADSQNLVDHDLLAYFRSNLFYLDFFASGNAILLAAGFYDRVHVNLIVKKFRRTNFPQNTRFYQRTYQLTRSLRFMCAASMPGKPGRFL